MQDGFYLATVTDKALQGGSVKTEDVLFFRQARSGFDSKADKEHIRNYAGLFGDFLKLHPDYKLPESFTKEEVGYGSVEVKPQPAPESVEGKTPNQETLDAVAKLLDKPKDGAEKLAKSDAAVEGIGNKELESMNKEGEKNEELKAALPDPVVNENREDIKDPVEAHLAEEEAKTKGKKK